MTRRIFTPREYQRIAAAALLNNQRYNLWARPGMGKTSIVYAVLDILQLAGSNFFPVLVLAPEKVARLVWPEEALKWDICSGLKIVPILGDRRQREDALMRRGDVYVMNYENIPWLVEHCSSKWPFRIIIADEATRLKNFRLKGQGGKRASALAKIAMQTGRWINLSGTPASNGLKDLWGQNWFVDFGSRLGHSYTAYMDRWFHVNPYSHDVEPRNGAETQIHNALADVSLALRPEDWFPINEANYILREVELPPPARKLYDEMERRLFFELDGREVNAVNAAARSGKLLQMTSGGVYDSEKQPVYIHEAKIEGLRSIINEMGGEPLLVAYWFKWELPMLQKAFPELRVFRTKKDQDDWNEGRIPLMAAHPQSAGHGVDLQHGGRAIVFFTQTWNLEYREQIIERLGPMRQLQSGYHRAVLVYDLLARNTMDVECLERTSSKCSVQDALLLARRHRRGDAPQQLNPAAWSDLV